VRLEFDSGCVANFTASRVSTERVRKLRFFQPHQYISVDYARQDVFALSVDPSVIMGNASPEALAAAAAKPGALPIPGVTLIRPEIKPIEPLKAELLEFLRAVRERGIPLVSLEDGRKALAVALDIHKAIAEHQRRAGLDQLMGKKRTTVH
jgi:predicted dehydrogenase